MKFSARAVEQEELEAATNKVETLINDYVASLLTASTALEREWNSVLKLSQEDSVFYTRDQLVERAEHLNSSRLTLTYVWLTKATFVVRKKSRKGSSPRF
ncbi:hypothetical protein [Moritella yayanosii]|uniref:Uncharacterized protein n=1 Tax=Moritella yayanosii TaxID=69539 RepID=A0A330LQL9_9GAMM|nr:hypothetical protein [Moritella yayanosii]SQD78261.1 protein of unknown function [Moritella yayanosii]